MNHQRPVIIGVAGGTGSGKTTVSRAIRDAVGDNHVAYIMHDNYYLEMDHLSQEEKTRLNFDHPNSLDTPLLVEHLRLLRDGVPIEVPFYDFATYSRTGESESVYPHPVIVVEGILIFAEPELRPLFDVKIFVDTEDDIRFIRRLLRDISERGRALESVVEQWLTTVKPMHDEFVEPSRRWADVIIPHGGKNRAAMDMVVSRIESLLRNSDRGLL
jgi:uridine kinase